MCEVVTLQLGRGGRSDTFYRQQQQKRSMGERCQRIFISPQYNISSQQQFFSASSALSDVLFLPPISMRFSERALSTTRRGIITPVVGSTSAYPYRSACSCHSRRCHRQSNRFHLRKTRVSFIKTCFEMIQRSPRSKCLHV